MEIEGQEVSRGKVEEEKGAEAPRRGRVVLDELAGKEDEVGTPEVSSSPESSGSSEEEDDQDGLWTGRPSNQPRIVVANGNGTSSSPSTPPNPSSRRSKPLPRDPSATTPSLTIAPHLLRQNTQDPFDQSHHKHHTSNLPPRLSINKPLAPSRSVPSFSSHLEANTDPSRRSGGRVSQDSRSEPTTPEKLLELYSFADQTRLLRSHYCRSEVRFLIALEDISNRLLVIPKLARVSALRAELTSLNHMLPAEVSLLFRVGFYQSFKSSSLTPSRFFPFVRSACQPGASPTTVTRKEARPLQDPVSKLDSTRIGRKPIIASFESRQGTQSSSTQPNELPTSSTSRSSQAISTSIQPNESTGISSTRSSAGR